MGEIGLGPTALSAVAPNVSGIGMAVGSSIPIKSAPVVSSQLVGAVQVFPDVPTASLAPAKRTVVETLPTGVPRPLPGLPTVARPLPGLPPPSAPGGTTSAPVVTRTRAPPCAPAVTRTLAPPSAPAVTRTLAPPSVPAVARPLPGLPPSVPPLPGLPPSVPAVARPLPGLPPPLPRTSAPVGLPPSLSSILPRPLPGLPPAGRPGMTGPPSLPIRR